MIARFLDCRACLAALLAGFLTIPALVRDESAAKAAKAQPTPVVVFAAASLKTALDEAVAAWGKETSKDTGKDTGKSAKVSYAGSNALAKQIESGAPADLFLSADTAWMDYAQKHGAIVPETRVDLLRNALVLIAPRDSAAQVAIEPGLDLAAALASGRLAMANVDAVPAGKYGKASLETLGAWDGVRDRIAQAENVRAALLLVSRGEAPLGIVYATDAAADPSVRIVGRFPADSHPPIVYPAARTRESRNDDATGLLGFLRGAAAKAIFENHGFVVVGAEKRS